MLSATDIAVRALPAPPLRDADLAAIRRRLADVGITPVGLPAEGGGGRPEDAELQPATLLEGETLAAHPVAASACWEERVGFVDGTERTWVAGYLGSMPIVVAEVAAAVRERVERTLVTVAVERRRYLIARPVALAAARDCLEGAEAIALPDDDAPHPVREQIRARAQADRRRAALEERVALAYRRRSPAWLVVDGTLTTSEPLARDPRAVGVIKSHAALPFEGDELVRYLRLPFAHRSSLFRPSLPPGRTPVTAWALRLWPWEERDLFHGLVRIEVAESTGTPEWADWLSCRLLAERAPVSAPDPRWDRLLYGIHAVEEYLRA